MCARQQQPEASHSYPPFPSTHKKGVTYLCFLSQLNLINYTHSHIDRLHKNFLSCGSQPLDHATQINGSHCPVQASLKSSTFLKWNSISQINFYLSLTSNFGIPRISFLDSCNSMMSQARLHVDDGSISTQLVQNIDFRRMH